jgi:hypothetical protein
MTKQSFKEATKLIKIFNTVVEWNGLKLATVMWHEDKQWKLVTTLDHSILTDRADKTHIIAEFRTQEDLWQYIKKNNLNS